LDVTQQPETGALLVLPLPEGNEASLARFHGPVRQRLATYRVRPGDTVDLIADRFNVTPYQIRRWNGLGSSRLTPGRTLHIYQRTQATAAHSSYYRRSTRSTHHAAHSTTAAKKPAARASRSSASASAATN
jgi:membrane-bound lytic murein transglycosylase D